MGEFSVGDRVVLTVDNPDGNEALTIGMCGTIVKFSRDYGAYGGVGVLWDNFTDGWGMNLDDLPESEENSGWFVGTSYIELAFDDKPEDEFIIDDAAFAVFADALS